MTFSTFCAILAYSPILLLITCYEVFAALLAFQSLYQFGFGSVLLPEVVVAQPPVRWIGGAPQQNHQQPISKAHAEELLAEASSFIVIQALGPVHMKQRWVKVFRARSNPNAGTRSLHEAVVSAIAKGDMGTYLEWKKKTKILVQKDLVTGIYRAKSHGTTAILPDWKWEE